MSKANVARAILLTLSLLMVWEALSPATFGSFFKRPFKDVIEVSYLVALAGSIAFVGVAVYHLASKHGTIAEGVLNLLISTAWCLILVGCAVLMAIRTGL
jgi:predicted membrane-bound spermidine synthase